MQTDIKTFIGIDPGTHGGIVVLRQDKVISTPLSALDKYDLRNWIESHCCISRGYELSTYACIEKVGGFMGSSQQDTTKPKHNVASAHTMFTFGESYGSLQMLLVCCRIGITFTTPKKWQSALAITPRKKGETKPQFKGRLKVKAQQLFPEEKITLETSDAHLLAYYLRGLHK